MHQTFYIDSDEEISSVIDRLRKSMSTDNYFVVPKRALFLQSIVNLKLLKREAEKIKKNVILVTQDEIGVSMAGRVGIPTQNATEGAEVVSTGIQEEQAEEEEDKISLVSKSAVSEKFVRLNGVGSNDFYDKVPTGANIEKPQARIQAKRKITARSRDINLKKEVLTKAGSRRSSVESNAYISSTKKNISHAPAAANLDPQKERVIEKMFQPERNYSNQNIPKQVNSNEGKKARKIFITFLAVCLLLAVGVVAYLFIPSAKIAIELNIQKKKTDFSVQASSGNSEINIPIRTVSSEEKISLSYDATGRSASSGGKAHGNVTIYNAFNNQPQTLVATTRISSSDGKIFRLVKTVNVPGMSNVAGQPTPGAITAEVIADQPGSDYNLEPTTFTIPGFAGSPKFDKFSAKSTEKMLGGSTDGQANPAISKDDLESAKKKTESAIAKKINETINAKLKSGEIILPEAQKISITSSNSNAKAGDATESFNYEVSATYSALIFSETDIKDKVKKQTEADANYKNMTDEVTRIDYATVNPDFDNNSIELKMHIEETLTPKIDLDELKRELLGKDQQQLEATIRKFTAIKNANVQFTPDIINRIPQYSQRLTVEVVTDKQN